MLCKFLFAYIYNKSQIICDKLTDHKSPLILFLLTIKAIALRNTDG